MNNLTEELRSAQERLERVEAAYDTTRKELETVRAGLDHYRQYAAGLENSLGEARGRISELEDERARLETDLSLAEAALADLRAQQTAAAGSLSPVQEVRLALMVAAIRSRTGHHLAEINRYVRWVMTGEADPR